MRTFAKLSDILITEVQSTKKIWLMRINHLNRSFNFNIRDLLSTHLIEDIKNGTQEFNFYNLLPNISQRNK